MAETSSRHDLHLNIERIGVIYGVHRATVARWLVVIRERLFRELREHFAATHGLCDTDVRSLYRILQQDVHVTISRVLQAQTMTAESGQPSGNAV